MRINEIETTVEAGMANASHAASSNIRLYRGMKVVPFQEQFVRAVRQDRVLKNSSPHEGRLFDLYCQMLGFPHRKRNTLSTALTVTQAAWYGITVYQIFPYNNASYLFSTKHKDLLDLATEIDSVWSNAWHKGKFSQFDLPIWSHQHDREQKAEIATAISDEMWAQMLTLIKEELTVKAPLSTTNDINQVAHGKGEVLVYVDQYVAKFYDHLKHGTE